VVMPFGGSSMRKVATCRGVLLALLDAMGRLWKTTEICPPCASGKLGLTQIS
jgi:hypothetical protein